MKIQCDVCNKEEASIFCCADEAALCVPCDRRVHHANKLASKHLRFSLQHDNSATKDSPCCDICQERRAFLFCQEDRAILCRECDVTIHKANEHTKKHNRFLLTGIKLSAAASSYQASPSSSKTHEVVKDSIKNEGILRPNCESTTSTVSEVNSNSINQNGPVSSSSMPDYLLEALPEWHVEDFLDPSCPPYGSYF